jgi:hypothetical protein
LERKPVSGNCYAAIDFRKLLKKNSMRWKKQDIESCDYKVNGNFCGEMKDYCSYKNNMNLEKYKYFLK